MISSLHINNFDWNLETFCEISDQGSCPKIKLSERISDKIFLEYIIYCILYTKLLFLIEAEDIWYISG